MSGVDHAPALVDRHLGEQPLDRPPAERGLAFLNFFRLLGSVDVDPRTAGSAPQTLALRIHARSECGATPRFVSGEDCRCIFSKIDRSCETSLEKRFCRGCNGIRPKPDHM
jgi:hypothetical protein